MTHQKTPTKRTEGLPLVIRKKKLLPMIGISASTLRDLQLAGKFPRPIQITEKRAAGWLSSDIEEWLAARAADRNAARRAEQVA